jgi:hypothetical protein
MYVGIVLFEEKNSSNIQNPHNHGGAVRWIQLHGSCIEPISLRYHLCDGLAEGAVEGFWLNM